MAAQGGIRAGRAFIEVFLDSSKVQAGLKRIGSRFKAAGASLARVGGMMVGGAGALAAPVALATKTYANFDDAMRRVEARSSGTAGEMAGLRQQAKELGRTTSSTATQIGNMMSSLAQKGFNRGQIAQMIPNVRNLAQAAGSGDAEADATMAADLVSGSLRAWQLESSESGRVADVFTAAVNNSNFTLEGLIDSMKTAAPIAKQYNLDLETTVATLAGMTNVNIDAASAGVAFRNMLLNASNAAKRSEFNKVLSDAGRSAVDFVDASGNLRPLPAILDDIGRATKGMGSADAGELLEGLFGKRTIVGAGAAASAISDTAGGFSSLLDVLRGAQGTAQKTAETMDAGLGGTFRRVWSAAEGMAIAIGESLAPALTKLEPVVVGIFGSISGLIEAMPEIIPITAAIVAGVGAAGLSLVGFGAALSIVGSAISALGVVAGIVLTPIGAIAAAIGVASAAVVGSALYEMWKDGAFEDIGEQLSQLAARLKDTFSSIATAVKNGNLKDAFELVSLEIQIQWQHLLTAMGEAWSKFVSSLPQAAWNAFKRMPGALQIATGAFQREWGIGGGNPTPSRTLDELEMRRSKLMRQLASEDSKQSPDATQRSESEQMSQEQRDKLRMAEQRRQDMEYSRRRIAEGIAFSAADNIEDRIIGTGAVGGFDVAGIQQGLAPSLYDQSKKQTSHLAAIERNTEGDEVFGT